MANEDFKANGYTYVKYDADQGCHVLRNEDGGLEAFFANKNTAGWSLSWRNTDLEFARSYIENA
jgi:hypothetical protein